MKKVILKSDVAGLGKVGDVKQVKDGFVRNYLLPRQLVLPATEANLKKVKIEREKIEAKRNLEIKKAQEVASRLGKLSVTMMVEVNDEGKPYGGLSCADIAKAIGAEGIDVDKKNIVLDAPLKELGIYDVSVKLHSEVITKVKIWVVKK